MLGLLGFKSTLLASGAAFVLGASSAGYFAYELHTIRVDALKAAWANERIELVAATKDAAHKQCDELNAKSEAVANALKADIDAINSRYVRLLKAKPVIARCLPLATVAPTSNGSTQPDVPTVRGGVAAEWLTDAAYDCDRQTARLVACQSALRGLYKN